MQQGKAKEVSGKMSHMTEHTYPRAYHLGRERRESGGNGNPPSILGWKDRHWWLAGWNDRDIELGK